ncbi:MBL fold metallo-hydrolase [Arthrobacter gyeryongensis]|uniref:MBL fold metallo-hydrolase n=1 Tax=Arthrobacter gyeryongensis TaxID=1650592 RepID=UPI0031E52432
MGDAVYLVDCGRNAAQQLVNAGFNVSQLRALFVTHLHSDHVIDLSSLLIFGMMALKDSPGHRIRILGPGDRGALPPASPRAKTPPQPVFPDNPTPGTSTMVDLLLRAHATDVNDRVLDALAPSPLGSFMAEDIVIPDGARYHPNENPTPEMEPFEIYADDLVSVTATLVRHPPIAPAFAFRFQTDDGSVTISGDTAPCENLVRLARRTDLLCHEAIDFDAIEQRFRNRSDQAAQASMDHHRKSHTSAEQAGIIASAAGAKALALHHLVPSNTDPAAWDAAARTFGGKLYIPDDLDVISFAAADETVHVAR